MFCMFSDDWPGFRSFLTFDRCYLVCPITTSANSVRTVRKMFIQPTFCSCTSFLSDIELLDLMWSRSVTSLLRFLSQSGKVRAGLACCLFTRAGILSERYTEFRAGRLHATPRIGSLALGQVSQYDNIHGGALRYVGQGSYTRVIDEWHGKE